jgi:nicotinate-nucleotide pyrophosphorylase (carboxylating)
VIEPAALEAIAAAALAEDVGEGDWTTRWTVPADRQVIGLVIAKAEGVIAGIPVAERVFQLADARLEVHPLVGDGDRVQPGQRIVRVEGFAQGVLTAERVALNFVQRLSGIATITNAYVCAVEGTGARILDTRKTTPNLRALEKAAVRAGGGENHRAGLHDMVLIKENHLAAAGGIAKAVAAVRENNLPGLKVEVEVTTLAEVDEAIAARVDCILFDNMPIEMLRSGVARVQEAVGSDVATEASGGITLMTVREIAETGVDFISVGALTHSAPALDISLLVEI